MDKKIQDLYDQTKFDFSKSDEKFKDFEWPTNWVKIYFKRYPRMDSFPIENTNYKGTSFTTLLNSRESTREFNDEEISLMDLGDLIYYSLGIKNPKDHPDKTRRMYPSAGARFPIEAYLIANNIEGIPKGLFHYDVKGNSLELLFEKNLREESKKIFGEENYETNPNYLALTSVMSRTEVKYGPNSYRFSMIEAGHIGQNFSLIAADKKLGCCAIGGFDNDRLVKLLDISEDEIPVYALAFGKPESDK